MAALSTTQSGNWNSSTTWGGSTPADGDTFTINRGHKVTVNSDERPTDGWGDITLYGNLHFATNAQFRLNGRITVWGQNTGTYNSNKWFIEDDDTTAGLLSSTGNNITIEVRGTNADQHGIWVGTQRFASMKLDGDEKKTTTELAVSANILDSYLEVDSTTGFAIGDWVAVYREQDQDDRVLGDEGFWVHDIDADNDRVYVRQFVSPTSTITNVSSNTLTVENARVFRKGYKIVFGTGSNRNTATISNINYNRNTLTLNTSVTGTVVGETVYQTGVETTHVVNDKVQKIATTLTTAITSADTTDQIVVGSANDIEVGDIILIDVNNDVDTNWDYDSQYTVTAKSGNTLTLDDQVRHLHKIGSLVNILTRHVTIKGVDTSTDTRPFLYVEYWTDFSNAHTRHIRLKNIRFTQWGNNTNNTFYRGVMIAGYNSEYRDDAGSDGRYQFQSRLQGCVIDNCNTANQDYTGFSLRHPYGFVFRNNTAYHAGNQPYFQWSSQHNVKWYNNYGTRSAYAIHYNDANYEPYSDTAYNYYTRSDDYGILMHQNRENIVYRHIILLHHEQRPFYMYYSTPNTSLYRIHIDGYRTFPHHGDSNGPVNWVDCYFGNKWYRDIKTGVTGIVSGNYLSSSGASGRSLYDRNSGALGTGFMYEFNHESGVKAGYFSGGLQIWDPTESAYKVVCLGSTDYPVFISSIFVPANTTVRMKCLFKGENNTNYTFPNLFAKQQQGTSNMGRYLTDYTGETTILTSSDTRVQNSTIVGFREQIQFTSACRGAWEEKQLTVQPKNSSYILVYGLHMNGNNAQEIGYMRDIQIFLDNAPNSIQDNMPSNKIKVRDGFTPSKRRISGRF